METQYVPASGLLGSAWLLVLIPLLGAAVLLLGGRRLDRVGHLIGCATILVDFVLGVALVAALAGRPEGEKAVTDTLFSFIPVGELQVDIGLLLDPLSAVFVLLITGVGALIHVYSIGYMAHDPARRRFFAYMNLFVAAMLLLVLGNGYVTLYIGWEGVGLASYLLIAFWYRRPAAATAAKKAFIMNRVGDVGLVLAIFIMFATLGSTSFADVFAGASGLAAGTVTAIGLLLLLGACGKSGQVPLQAWLPDAMEGPTPVSALIHAATMVTAGVYLIARCFPLFELAPAAADVSAIIGTATLIFAASVALAATDLKRVIAYSTMSQIGYMVLGVSVAAYGAGLFHLMTHAFFKALLFMGAGSVIAAMGGIQSLDRMGGFRKSMPFTFWTFTIGALALAGFPLTSGFFSKDEILAFTLNRGGLYVVLGVVGYIAALLTAFYAFRMVFRVFLGAPVPEARELEAGHMHHGDHANPATGEEEDTGVGFPGAEHHIAEREWPMKAAMGPLALLAVVAGVLGIPGVTETFERFLEPTFEESRFHEVHPSEGAEYAGLAAGGLAAIVGIAVAWVYFMRNPGLRSATRERFAGVHRVLINKWYFDELFDAVVVRPGAALGRFGRTVVESTFVQGVLVGGTVGLVRAGTSLARSMQNGEVRAYAALLLLGLGGLVLYFLIVST